MARLLAARTGEEGELAADVERQSHAFILNALGINTPSAALGVALAGWPAFERDACLAWLDYDDIPDEFLKAMLLATLTAAVTAASAHDSELTVALQHWA